MYDRDVKNKTLTFQVSGMLWQRSLVMRDLETKSLWSHLMGKAMDGQLKGTSLDLFPAAMTTWGEWKQRHPNTTLLAMSRSAMRFDKRVWENASRFVYGTTPHVTGKSISVALQHLQKKKIVQTPDGKQHLLFTYSDHGKRVQSFSRMINGKALNFLATENDTMTDQETGSTWNAVTGRCLTGKLKGTHLKRIPGTISYLRAWQIFFPNAKVIP